MSEGSAIKPKTGQGAASVIIDYVFGLVAAILTTALFAMIGDGVQPEVLLMATAYVGVIMLLGRKHAWSVTTYMRRLRERPNDLGSPGN